MVLVILVILLAMLLATLTGFIQKSDETKAIAEARQVSIAANLAAAYTSALTPKVETIRPIYAIVYISKDGNYAVTTVYKPCAGYPETGIFTKKLKESPWPVVSATLHYKKQGTPHICGVPCFSL